MVNGYALTFASFMLAAGMLGDILGRKRIMLAGVAIFCAGSVVCALATNVDWLIVGRVIMGIGAAASEPGTLSIIRHVYPDRETRADALGVWAAVSGLALALGPVIVGALVGFSSWRAIFWFNLGFGAVAFVLAAVFVPESADRQGRRIDYAGFLFGATFLACLSVGVIQGEEWGYTTPSIVALFVLCALSGIAFLVTERKVKSPMLDLSLFRRPPFAGSNFVAFVAYFGTFSIFFFTALYLQVVVNVSAYQAAIDFLPMAAGLILVSALTGPLVARVGPRGADDRRLPASWRRDPPRQCAAGAACHLRDAGLGPPDRRDRPRHAAGAGHLRPAHGGAARTLRHGRLGHQHQPGDGRGVRRGHLGLHRQREAHRRLGGAAEGDRHPPNFQSLVIHAVQTGGTTGGAAGSAEHSKNAAVARIATKVVNAAYDAFGSGLHEALVLSGCLILVGAVVAATTIHRPSGETFEV